MLRKTSFVTAILAGCAVLCAPQAVQAASLWSSFPDGPYGGFALNFGRASEADDPIAGGDRLGFHLGYLFAEQNLIRLGLELDQMPLSLSLDGGGALTDLTRLKATAGLSLGRSMAYMTGGLADAEFDLADGPASDTGVFGGLGFAIQTGGHGFVSAEVLWHQFQDIDGGGTDTFPRTVALRMSFTF